MNVPSIGPHGIDMPVDDVITGLVDLARLVLMDALSAPEPPTPPTLPDTEILRRTQAKIVIANIYQVLEMHWQTVLWGDYELQQEGDEWFLVPRDGAHAQALAVWEFRHEQRVIEAAQHTYRLAKDNFAATTQASRTVVGATRGSGGVGLTVGERSESHDRRHVELSIALQADDFLLGEKLPRFGDGDLLDLRLMVSAWGVLHDLVQQLHPKSLATETFTATDLLGHAPVLSRRRLATALADALRVSDPTAFAIIDFLTFAPERRAGLWGHPIVRLNDDDLLLVAPSIVSGNPIRATEHWLRAAGLGFTARGGVFEQDVRDAIHAAISQSAGLPLASCTRTAVTVAGEEIDILIRIGNRIIVGETKSSVFPSEPVEVHNYLGRQIDNEAIPQAKRKTRVVAENLEETARHFGANASDFAASRVSPLVIVNHILGTGLERNGVPVCNVEYLTRYFRDGSWGFGHVFERGVADTPQLLVPIYGSEREAERDCIAHFGRHPAMLVLFQHCKLEARPIPLADGVLRYVHFRVDGYPPVEEIQRLFFGDPAV